MVVVLPPCSYYNEEKQHTKAIENLRSKLIHALLNRMLQIIDIEIREHVSPLLNDDSINHSKHLSYAVLLYYSVKIFTSFLSTLIFPSRLF